MDRTSASHRHAARECGAAACLGDLRFCRFFRLSEGFWLRMQASHDLKRARLQIGDALADIEPLQHVTA
jgi:hypothetical protein